MNKLIASLLVYTLLFNCINTKAAIPIPNRQSETKREAKKPNEDKREQNDHLFESQKHFLKTKIFQKLHPKERAKDEGVFGILSFVFGLLGIFPAAIILGIIGLEERRKYKGLAIAGLVLGLLTLLVYALLFYALFYLL